MDFENARWVKLYCQDTGTWLRLGWQGRTVALHLLRSVNSSGVLSDLGTEPELILAELLRLPLEVVTPGLSALVRTGTVTLGGGILVWTAFVDAQCSRKSETQRKAEYRAKHRQEAISGQNGTRCPESGTERPESVPVCPECPTAAGQTVPEEKRGEEKRQERTEELIPTTGIASRPVVTVEPQPTRSEVRAAEAANRSAEKAAEKAAAKLQREADRAAKQEADRLAKEAKRAAYEKDKADAKEKRTATTHTNGSTLFAAYRGAFLRRYGAEPLRDARTGAHFARIAKKTIEGRATEVSADDALAEACLVCVAYLQSAIPYHVQSSHPPGLLERDWHKLLTEHRTGKVITPRLAGKSQADLKREADNAEFIKSFGMRCDAISVPSAPRLIEPRREED